MHICTQGMAKASHPRCKFNPPPSELPYQVLKYMEGLRCIARAPGMRPLMPILVLAGLPLENELSTLAPFSL